MKQLKACEQASIDPKWEDVCPEIPKVDKMGKSHAEKASLDEQRKAIEALFAKAESDRESLNLGSMNAELKLNIVQNLLNPKFTPLMEDKTVLNESLPSIVVSKLTNDYNLKQVYSLRRVCKSMRDFIDMQAEKHDLPKVPIGLRIMSPFVPTKLPTKWASMTERERDRLAELQVADSMRSYYDDLVSVAVYGATGDKQPMRTVRIKDIPKSIGPSFVRAFLIVNGLIISDSLIDSLLQMDLSCVEEAHFYDIVDCTLEEETKDQKIFQLLINLSNCMTVDFLGKDGFDASTIVSPAVYEQLQEFDESLEREDVIKTEEGVQENRADMRMRKEVRPSTKRIRRIVKSNVRRYAFHKFMTSGEVEPNISKNELKDKALNMIRDMKPKMHGRPRLALETLKRKINKNPKRFQTIYQKYVQRNRPAPVRPIQERIDAARARLTQEVGHIWRSSQTQSPRTNNIRRRLANFTLNNAQLNE
ncbi:hypothetical protein WR25_05613 [Diploscapter pachys]|uniref:Uncharacterized protein n=1 Tax=Diploscapter pachys TaxID=2018661 RepID=A0A2A2JQZ0_9BILA|nr:hypothetical protein WR25_05613 [Diploscapter pachys]